MSVILKQTLAGRYDDEFSSDQLEDLTLRKMSLDEYERLVEMGFFDEDERIELLDGIVVELEPLNARHADAIDSLNELLLVVIPLGGRIRIQSPIRLASAESQPLPDVAVLARQKNYGRRHPENSDVLLVVEVADSSLSKDRNRKRDLYARTGIQEYWIVNLIDDQLEVYRKPDVKPNGNGFYHSRTIYLPGQMVTPLAFPTCEMDVATMFPEVGSDDL